MLELYNWTIEEAVKVEMLEYQAKNRKELGGAYKFRKLGLRKYNRTDLAEHLEKQKADERDTRLKSFQERYDKMAEIKAFEMKPTSSIADPTSPRESDSMASITPSGEYSRTRGFFKD